MTQGTAVRGTGATEVQGYQLGACIHESSSCFLFRARRNADGARVVLKVLKSVYPTAVEIAKLRHEYSLLTALAVPGVVKALGLERVGNGIALVLEDVGGTTLHDVVSRGPMDVLVALRVAESVALTVAALHEHGIIHKDVKPHNVVVDPASWTVHLVDFGIATRLSQEVHQPSSLGRLEGTLAYMSPEQTGRMNRVSDSRTDLYSLGVTLYEMLTGVLPFQTTDPVEMVHSHIAKRPRSPSEVRPEVPAVVSEIVLKLLAKAPEDRYHGARGLAADLHECARRLAEEGRVDSFEIGAHDFAHELKIAQRLYGRETETAAMLEAFDRAAGGTTELFFVSGYSGVGKSALVHEIHKPIAHRGGDFISGKFDQFNRSVPYAPVVGAFRELLRHILGESPATLASWKSKLADALGTNAQVIIELCPELELVLGPQPAVPDVGLTETQNRFILTFQSFVRVFLSRERPLVLFLDDVQWADAASLKLLQNLVTDTEARYLLLICAYRDNEVGPGHLLSLTLDDLVRHGAVLHAIRLGPLAIGHLTALVADSLRTTPERARPLALLVHEKTHGNPFFVNQFLRTLYKHGLLVLAPDGRWSWDLERIRSTMVTDNVITFLVENLQRLPPVTRRVLSLAACIGHEFDIETLSLFHEKSAVDTATDLWDALREGLVLPLGSEYRFLHAGDVETDTTFPISYRFLHDRVQQAAYSLIDEARRQEVHLWNGRLLRVKYASAPSDKDLFDVVANMNFGSSAIDDPEERRDLAQLNLLAGRKAKDAAAYEVAAKLLDASAGLLGPRAWDFDYDVVFAANLARAEAEFLSGRVERAFDILALLEKRARTSSDRVPILELSAVVLTSLGRLDEAAKRGTEAAALLGAVFPEDRAELARVIDTQWAEVLAALAAQPIEALADLRPLSKPDPGAAPADVTATSDRAALIEVLYRMVPAVYQSDPDWMLAIVLKAVALSLQYGQARPTGYFFVLYGAIHGAKRDDFETGYRLGRAGLALAERRENRAMLGPSHFLFGTLVCHFHSHAAKSLEHLRIALPASLEAGDYLHAAYCVGRTLIHRFLLGEELGAIQQDLASSEATLRRIATDEHLSDVHLVAAAIDNLQGKTQTRTSLDHEGYDEAASLAKVAHNAARLFHHHVFRQMLLYLAGDFHGSFAAAEQAAPLADKVLGLYALGDHVLYAGLALAALQPERPLEKHPRDLERMRGWEQRLRRYAEGAPENFAPRRALLAAEIARIEGNPEAATDLYDDAITSAHNRGFVPLAALASELCAGFHLGRGRSKIAAVYLTDAHYDYVRWGAVAKADELLCRHSDLIGGDRARERLGTGGTQVTSTSVSSAGQLDVETAIRAAQAISSELVLDKVLEKLMWIVIENAGARRGFLILNRNGSLRIEAAVTADPNTVRVGLDQEVGASNELARSIVRYVERTHEPVIVGDAPNEPRFVSDPYIRAAHPRSILCIAMTHQGKMAGILYLENEISSHAFSPARVELLQMIASQTAIAVENAILYADVQVATRRLREANENLEREVAERTQKLRHALDELWSEMDLARKIQTVLLPVRPSVPGYDVSCSMQPASSVGGDYYDVMSLQGEHWVLIGDVSGHGVPAGLIMMMARTAIRTVAETVPRSGTPLSPARLLTEVNGVLCESVERMGTNAYMTIMGLRIEGGTIHYAGLHQDILVHRAATDRVERVETTGVWLGLVKDIGPLLDDRSIELCAGDTVLLFTDGITEARHDGALVATSALEEMFVDAVRSVRGTEGDNMPQPDAADALPRGPAEAILNAIVERAQSLDVTDDVTLVVLRRDASGGER
ncbi:MAG: AAA family ATPase [Polyangiaceae bacterium]|nr:AAA family ATPase [Polyangiaceae bacterium]